MHYYLAVDAGGTKTELVLADETHVLTRTRTGSIKRLRETEDSIAGNLRSAFEALETGSGLSLRQVKSCCIGTSGETVPLVVDWLRSAFSARIDGQLLILGDVEIALDAHFPGAAGVLVLAGTGSNVAGRTGNGVIHRAGGWGPVLADQGSGHFIGVEALRRGFLAIDQQRPTRLLEIARDFWRLPHTESLIEFANSNPSPRFSDLASHVAACAEAGDEVAREVLQQGGRDLAAIASVVVARVQAADMGLLPAIALAGSVIVHCATLRQSFSEAMNLRFPGIEVLTRQAEPVNGALWRARNM